MEILGNALATVIVGALTIPWVLLAYHLFSPVRHNRHVVETSHHSGQPTGEHATADKAGTSPVDPRIAKLANWVRNQNQTAVAGVLLFAMAFFLGSVVSRIAQDFLDDDDLHAWPTETRIRVNTYCYLRAIAQEVKTTASANSPKGQMPEISASDDSGSICAPNADNDQKTRLGAMEFQTREAAVLLQGTDKNERLRQYQDQIIVLRGAVFSGLVTFSLCLFWWCARIQSWLRRIKGLRPIAGLFWGVPLLYGGVGMFALNQHTYHSARGLDDPPYMEFTWFVLAIAGTYLLITYAVADYKRKAKKTEGWPGNAYLGYLVLASLLTITAYLGWWATDILYDQLVIYSYKALPVESAKPASDK